VEIPVTLVPLPVADLETRDHRSNPLALVLPDDVTTPLWPKNADG